MGETAMETGVAAYVPTARDPCLKDNTKKLTIGTNFTAQSSRKEASIRLARKKSAMVGLILTILIVVLTAVGPKMDAYSYSVQNIAQKNFAPRVPGLGQFGIPDGSETILTTSGSKKVNSYREKKLDNVYHWFGSDGFGRDLWTRTWSGARVSLMTATVAAVIDMFVGTSYGLISGYFRGKVDITMQRILETSNGIPRFVIVTLLLLVSRPRMLTIISASMPTGWIGMSRIVRAEMLKLKKQEFVLAFRASGVGPFFIIFKEILPNIIGPIIIQVMFSIPTVVLTKAFLSFAGLGVLVPRCSLDSLINDGLNSLTTHSFQTLPPITVMASSMLSFSLVGNGLHKALNPRLEEM